MTRHETETSYLHGYTTEGGEPVVIERVATIVVSELLSGETHKREGTKSYSALLGEEKKPVNYVSDDEFKLLDGTRIIKQSPN